MPSRDVPPQSSVAALDSIKTRSMMADQPQ
jgi:hypothetical protein